MTRTILSIIFIIASLSIASADNSVTVRIKSGWDRRADRHLNIESGSLRASAIDTRWHSAVWVLEPTGTGRIRIKNYWKPDQYIHMESGALAAGPIERGWSSAQWVPEIVEDTNTVRLRSAWKPDHYIHIEKGVLAVGIVEDHWHSARWELLETSLPVRGDQATCIEWAYAKLEKETDAGTARDVARATCKTIKDLELVQLLYTRLTRSRGTARQAITTAAKLATADLVGKQDLLAFMTEALLAVPDYTAEIAVRVAIDKAKPVEASALGCMKREYTIYAKSMTPYYALEKAIEACR